MPIFFPRYTAHSLGQLSSTTIPVHPLNQTYCRPAGIRGAKNALAIEILDDAAKAERSTKPPPSKCRKLVPKREEPVNLEADPNREEVYHFAGCVLFGGNWMG